MDFVDSIATLSSLVHLLGGHHVWPRDVNKQNVYVSHLPGVNVVVVKVFDVEFDILRSAFPFRLLLST